MNMNTEVAVAVGIFIGSMIMATITTTLNGNNTIKDIPNDENRMIVSRGTNIYEMIPVITKIEYVKENE